jgi:hypothetical protein
MHKCKELNIIFHFSLDEAGDGDTIQLTFIDSIFGANNDDVPEAIIVKYEVNKPRVANYLYDMYV